MVCRYLACSIVILFLALPCKTWADWRIEKYKRTDSDQITLVATTRNTDGFELQIYKDENNVVRSRFSLMNTNLRMDQQYCPTFDIRNRSLQNTSINGEKCLSDAGRAEFVLGYISDGEVMSTPLYNIMNGSNIVYRFIIKPYGYSEAVFSLNNSKRALLEALGTDLTVMTDSGYSN